MPSEPTSSLPLSVSDSAASQPVGQVSTAAAQPAASGNVSHSSVPPAAGRYRGVRLHAQGGLGEVHLAIDDELQRTVALKRLRVEYAGHAASRQRFLREAEVTALLEHPGVVPVLGLVHDSDGEPLYAMRFVEGESLKDAIERYHGGVPERRLVFRKLLQHFIAVCNTVGYAHSRGAIRGPGTLHLAPPKRQ